MNNITPTATPASTVRPLPIVRRATAITLLVGVLTTATACGSDADAAELVDQYCTMVADVERHAEQVFTEAAEAAGDAEMTTEQMFDAEREVLTYIQQQEYDQMDKPSAIADDWDEFFDGFTTKLAAATPEPPSAEAQAAEERLLTWEETNCGS